MTATAHAYVPADWDVRFLFRKARTVQGFGLGGIREEDGQLAVEFHAPDYAAVMASIESYPVDRLEVDLPAKLAAISAERDRRIRNFEFMGVRLDLEGDTKRDLADAALGLMRNPDVEGIDWSMGGGEFVFLSREALLGLADLAFRHIQQTFAGHRRLAVAAKAAADIHQLALVDEMDATFWTAEAPNGSEAPNEPQTSPLAH
jgi:hypothetical protein